jgi:uncharacterized protein (TIGR00369 family)
MRRPIEFRNGTNRCYGCGSDNPAGLRLQFFATDEGIEVDYVAPAHLEGAPGILHGGVQGTLLDEAFCMAAYARCGTSVVTGELTVRYLRPVPTGTALVVRGRIVEERERSYGVEGGIYLAATGEELSRGRGWFFVAPRTGEGDVRT